MKLPFRRVFKTPGSLVCGILAIAFFTGLTRLRLTSRAEPEFWSVAIGDLVETTTGRLVDTTPVYQRKPVEQLEFWTPRISGILAIHPRDAGLHAAAALIYDKPSDGMTEAASKAALESKINFWELGRIVFEAIHKWISPYDQTATPLAIELSQHLIALEPDNPQWLRLQAAISVRPQLYPEKSVPRSMLLNDLSARAVVVDPDNGVYDLLIAANMMEEAMEFDAQLADPGFRFVNRAAAEEARELALQAIRKPVLHIGEPGWEGLNRLHEMAGHPRRGTTESMMSRSTRLRLRSPLFQFVRLLLWAGQVAERDGEPDALEFYLASNLTCEAISRKGGEAYFPLTEYRMIRELALNDAIRIQQLGDDSELSKERQIVANEKRAIENALAAKPPARRNRNGPWLPTVSLMSSGVMLFGLLTGSLPLIVLCVLTHRSATWRFGVVPWLALVTSFSLTSVFLGAGPAGLVSTDAQDWLALILIVTAGVVFTIGCAIRLGKRPQFRLKSLLMGCLVAAVAIAILRVIDLGIPPALHVEGDQGMQTIAASGQSASDWIPGPQSVSSSVMQWLVQDGAAMTVWCTLALVGLIGFVRGRFVESIYQCVTFAILMSLLALNVWVWSYPSLLSVTKERNDEIRQFMSEPQAYYAELREEYTRQLASINQEA